MSDIERLFLAAYPLWPKKLIEKFSSLLSLEVAKFNPEVNRTIVNLYNEISAPVTLSVPQNGVLSIFKPDGKNSVRADYVFHPQIHYTVDEFGNYSPSREIACTYAVYFDNRLFSKVSASLSVNNIRTGEFNYVQNPNFVRLSSPSNFFTGSVPESIKVFFLIPQFTVTVSPELVGYSGVSTVVAMVKNGITVDVDRNLLYEFNDFLNAYLKYSSQLSAGMSLQNEKNKQDIQQYKNSITEKLAARKNEINDLRTQITFAAKNETSSAKRDMQNLAINVQSLMLQLQEKMQ